MKIILFTQEDPFYLVESTLDLIQKIKKNNNHEIVQAIITPPSPFGKRQSFIKKTFKTLNIFGFNFFLYYSYKYIIRKIIQRKSVRKIFEKNKINVKTISDSINSKENIELVRSLNADLILIIAGNQIIKKDILKSTKFGIFNVHSSLLPEYKGLMPTFWVLKNEEDKTGVTLYKLTEGIDDGPIIANKEFKIPKNFDQSRLVKKLKILANDLIVESLHLIKNSNIYTQPTTGSYYKFPTKIDVQDFLNKNKRFY